MSMTQIDLINAALIKLGAAKITSLNDGSTEADIASTLYTPVRDGMLALYPWGFATAQVVLATPTTPPTADYTYAFSLPADHVRTLSVGDGTVSHGASFRVQGTTIETDLPQITLSYIRRGSESTQPPHFNLAFIARLAAEFCLPLTENTSRAETLYRLAERELVAARSLDAQQDTPARLSRFNLIETRG